MEKKEEKKVCCICGKEYEGYGYNPFPVKEEGCCCQSCNYSVVVPERWERHKAYQRGEATGAGKVYISGAIAHYDMDERKEAFSRAEEELKAQGYDPVNPSGTDCRMKLIGESTCGPTLPCYWLVTISIC